MAKTKDKKTKKPWNAKLFVAKLLIFMVLVVAVGVGARWSSQIERGINFLIHNDGGTAVIMDDGLTVHFIDVGQADAIAIDLPDDGGVIMVDSGSKSTAKLNEYLSTYIFKNGRDKTFEHFILTHSDADHVGGAKWMFTNNYTAKNFHRPKSFVQDEITKISTGQPVSGRTFPAGTYTLHNTVGYNDYIKLMNQQVSAGASVSFNEVGKVITEGLVTITFYGPHEDNYGGSIAHRINTLSPIKVLEYKGKRIMLTGDATKENEDELNYSLIGKVDVLKVAHHGGNTSSSKNFLDNVVSVSTYAVISVGNNKYGHPHPKVIERLEAAGIASNKIYSTLDNGNIIVTVGLTSGGTVALAVASGVPNEVFWVTYWQMALVLVLTVFTALFTNEIIRLSRRKK